MLHEGKPIPVPRSRIPDLRTELRAAAAACIARDREVRFVQAGWRKPHLADPLCLAKTVHPPASHPEVSAVIVKFAVTAEGHPILFHVMKPSTLPVDLRDAIVRGVIACDWEPGADTDGTPQTIWVVQPLRFE